MNLKQFKTLWKNNKIIIENHQIDYVSLNGLITLYLKIRFKPQKSRYTSKDEICIDIDKCSKLIETLEDAFEGDTAWDTKDLEGKYVRLCFYKTPENEMNELSDKYQLVAFRHIINDDDDKIMFL